MRRRPIKRRSPARGGGFLRSSPHARWECSLSAMPPPAVEKRTKALNAGLLRPRPHRADTLRYAHASGIWTDSGIPGFAVPKFRGSSSRVPRFQVLWSNNVSSNLATCWNFGRTLEPGGSGICAYGAGRASKLPPSARCRFTRCTRCSACMRTSADCVAFSASCRCVTNLKSVLPTLNWVCTISSAR